MSTETIGRLASIKAGDALEFDTVDLAADVAGQPRRRRRWWHRFVDTPPMVAVADVRSLHRLVQQHCPLPVKIHCDAMSGTTSVTVEPPNPDVLRRESKGLIPRGILTVSEREGGTSAY